FVVGPGFSTTYGTGRYAAATPRTRIRPLTTKRVTLRRDMAARLGASADAYPLGVAVGEQLVLPDRHRCLEIVDQAAAGLEGLGAVRAGDGHDHRQVADLQVADPVHGGHRADREICSELLHDPA